MVNKLTTLLAEFQNEAQAAQAKVVAATAQLKALESAHNDTRTQIDAAKQELDTTRAALAQAKRDMAGTLRDSGATAGKAVQDASLQAADIVANAEKKAKEVSDAADGYAARINDQADRKKQQLTSDIAGLQMKLTDLSTKIDRLKGQARQFVGD